MSDPSRAFKDNPHVRARFELDFTASSPVIGGRPLNPDGSEYEPAEASFGRAHFDQFMHGDGWIEVDGVRTTLDGYGDRPLRGQIADRRPRQRSQSMHHVRCFEFNVNRNERRRGEAGRSDASRSGKS